MGLFSKLKAILGLSDSGSRSGRGTTVAVEREPDAATERAVKEGGPREDPEPEGAVEGETSGGADAGGETDAAEADTGGEPDTAEESIGDVGEPEVTEDGPEIAEAEPGADEGEADDDLPDVDGGDEPVETIKGIGPAYAERLGEAGVATVAELAAADAGELEAATDISASRIETWIERARGG